MLKRLYIALLRFGFRLLYNEMAFTYDLVSWIVSLGEWRSWQRAAISHMKVAAGSRVLEIAHGTANLQIDLRTLGYDSIGLDLSPYMGRIARRKLIKHGIAPKLARGKAQALPFPDESFPAVVSTFPTDFIIDPATIAEIYRILKPGGRLVFVPNGVLTKGGIAREGLEAAYRATGQRSPWPVRIADRFSAAGFTVQQIVVPCKLSIAEVIVAEKAAGSI
jgi:ubiquinone/menaquinone biosynthesis C-methylase UbiE